MENKPANPQRPPPSLWAETLNNTIIAALGMLCYVAEKLNLGTPPATPRQPQPAGGPPQPSRPSSLRQHP